MKLTVEYIPSTGAYSWTLLDGPDGIHEVFGFAGTLEEVVRNVQVERELIARQYA
jgi:hypothetical protein